MIQRTPLLAFKSGCTVRCSYSQPVSELAEFGCMHAPYVIGAYAYIQICQSSPVSF